MRGNLSLIKLSLLILVVAVAVTPTVAASPAGKLLTRVTGTVAFQLSPTAPAQDVAGEISLNDDATALTRSRSTARVSLEDSSVIGIGQNTSVRLGAFNNAAAGPGSTITLNNGSIRFNITHPSGGKSNYRFITPTSQLGVRGTSGLYASGPNGDDIVCVQCDPGDAVVTVGQNTYALVSGQAIHITIGGIVTAAAITHELAQTFEQQGLSMQSERTAVLNDVFQPQPPPAAAVPPGTLLGGAAAIGIGAIIVNAHRPPGPSEPGTPATPSAGLTVKAHPMQTPAPFPTKTPHGTDG